MGGTDDPGNIIELTIDEHAEAHRILYEKYGKWQDRVAWMALSGLINKEEILKEVLSNAGKMGGLKVKEMKIGIHVEDDELKRYWSSLQPIEAKIRGGKTSGRLNSESGHCKKIAHLGGKSSSGMKFWYNPKNNEETRSFESPGNDWILGVKMDRINIEMLRMNSSNRKDSFWIYNPITNESKMIFDDELIPDGFIKGRNNNIENTIELLNVGHNSDIDLDKIKSKFNGIYFDNFYKRWVFTFKLNGKKNKITHIDYYGLVYIRDCIINYYNLNLERSELYFDDKYSKEESVELLKSFREYLKIERILNKKLKKSKSDIYKKRLLTYIDKYNIINNAVNISKHIL